MLRKDVKLGLAVGGVLLAVLVLYVLVVPTNETTDPGQAQSSAVSDANQADPIDGAAPVVVETPVTDPFAAQVEVAVTGDAPVSRQANGWNWDAMLDGRQAPPAMMSESAVSTTPLRSEPQPFASAAPTFLPETPTPSPSLILPSSAGPRQYVIQKGDTLSDIAKTAYGKASYYAKIQEANPGLNPNNLKLGTTIVLPDVTESRPATATPAVPTSAALAPDEYQVRPSDSLYSISLRLYGKADRIDRIYELNQSTIGPDRNALTVGTVLKLPEPPTVQASAQ